MLKRAALATWIGLLLALAVSGAAEESTPWAYDAQNELMSPFCPGRTLADCPSPDAASVREWLLVQEAAGRTRAEVEAELYARYGDQMRPAPKAEGVGLAAYVFPAVALVLGALVLAVFLRRATRAAPPAAPAAALVDPELERLVDEELAR